MSKDAQTAWLAEVSSMPEPTDNRSVIWEQFANDYVSGTHFRGTCFNYSASTASVIRFYRAKRFAYLASAPFRSIGRLGQKVESTVLKIFSTILLGSASSYRQFALNKCRLADYERASNLSNGFFSRFQVFSSNHAFHLSHTGIKNFYYYTQIEPYLPQLAGSKCLRVLEIGAGFFTFGYILSRHIEAFEYVVVDLPEMIFSATTVLLSLPERDFEIFFPNQVVDFINSPSNRKVLFLTPSDFEHWAGPHFDLFVNFESFAEMDIATVNSYLERVRLYLRAGGLLFTVNRHSRPQAVGRQQFEALCALNQITSFRDYQLDFCDPLVERLCAFRQCIPIENEKPNVFYIGRRKSVT